MHSIRFRTIPRAGVILLATIALVPSTWLFWQARDAPFLGLFQDGGLYCIAAKSLAEGKGYLIASLPGEPYQTKYPPLYPAMLSLIWRANPSFPGNLPAIVCLSYAFWLAYLVSAYLTLRHLRLSPAMRWGVTGFIALMPVCIYLSFQIMAEALFSTLVLCAILAAAKAEIANGGKLQAAGAGVLGGLAYLAKSAALPLLVTVPLVFAIRKQYARAAWFLAAMLPLVSGWTIWSSMHRLKTADPALLYYTDYLNYYLLNVSTCVLPSVLSNNLSEFVLSIGRAMTSIPAPTQLMKAFLIAIGIWTVMGTTRLLIESKALQLGFFAALYTLQLLVWNFTPNERFLFPLMAPLLAGIASAVACSLKTASVFAHSRLWPAAAWTSCVVAGSACLLYSAWRGTSAEVPNRIRETHRNLASKREVFEWIKRSLPESAAFAAYQATELYLYTQRKACRIEPPTRAYYMNDLPAIKEPFLHLADFAHKHGLQYILWADDDYAVDSVLADNAVREALLKQNQGLRLIHEINGSRIYAVESPADAHSPVELPGRRTPDHIAN